MIASQALALRLIADGEAVPAPMDVSFIAT
jgi:hypothetical protein